MKAAALKPMAATLPEQRDLTFEELRAKQTSYREVLTKYLKPFRGRRGVFQQVAALYESVIDSGDPAIAELRPKETLKEGEQLVESLELHKTVIEAWSCRNAGRQAAKVDALQTIREVTKTTELP